MENQPVNQPNQPKLVNDTIHGSITIHPLCVKIIDTPEFQRLRYLKQLGCTHFVYPNANHSRFAHCIGVYHLARRVVEKLNEQLTGEGSSITERDQLCVTIAGLCHDLGHGPFSHMWESFVRRLDPNSKWNHEDMSVKIFKRIWDKRLQTEDKEEYELDDSHKKFIENLILGTPDDRKEQFLFQIVNSKETGIDVDKWDYVLRDSYYLGFKCPFDHERLLQFIRVNEVPNTINGDQATKKQVICFRDTEIISLYNLFYTRWQLHKRAYQHRVSRIMERMLTDALLAAKDFLTFNEVHKLENCINNLDLFLQLDDGIFNRILWELDPTHEARKLVARIERRDLYQSKNSRLLSNSEVDLKILEEHLNVLLPHLKDKFYIDVVMFDYGKKKENPIKAAYFYKKNDCNRAFLGSESNEISCMLPNNFWEVNVSCVIKSNDISEERVNDLLARFNRLFCQ